MKNSPLLPAMFWRLLFAAALVAVALLTDARADDSEYALAAACSPQADSWIFARSRYSHDPDTGARVAQYAMKPPVEALPDQRAVTSVYTRSRTVQRGADGSTSTYYRVTNFGNGRGGLDAEWERFHDAWRGSTVAGGNFQGVANQGFGYGFGGPGFGPGVGGPGFGGPGHGGPGFVGPGHGGRGRWGNGFRNDPRAIYGPGYGQPDAGRLDPDATDGYRQREFRTPDRLFFKPIKPKHEHDEKGKGGGKK